MKVELKNSVPAIDLVLATGSTKTDVTNFGADLKKAISDKGYDPSKLQIKEIKRSAKEISKSFNWEKHRNMAPDGLDDTGCPERCSNYDSWPKFMNKKAEFINTEDGVEFLLQGNPKEAGSGFDFVRLPNTTKVQKFEFDYNIDFGDNFTSVGMIVGMKYNPTDHTVSGTTITLNKNGNSSVNILENFNVDNNFRQLRYKRSTSLSAPAVGHFEIEVRRGQVTVKSNNGSQTFFGDQVYLPGSGFGFYSDQYSHNCGQIGQFKFEKLTMAETNEKTLTEILQSPSFRPDSARVVLNVSDSLDPGLFDQREQATLLSQLVKQGVHYIAWDSASIRNTDLRLINLNDKKGTAITDKDYQTSINETADYLIANFYGEGAGGSDFVVVDKPIEVSVTPESAVRNTNYGEFPNGRWKIVHDSSFFANNSGTYEFSEQYIPDLPQTFNKTGKYDIYYEDKLVRTVFIHRLPTADFDIFYCISGNTPPPECTEGATNTVKVKSKSFDADSNENKSGLGNGIAEEEWSWRFANDNEWHSGINTSSVNLANTAYQVRLRVKDEQGEWSQPVIKTISSGARPVAEFSFINNVLYPGDTLQIVDSSYTPNTGASLSQYTWRLEKWNGVDDWTYQNQWTAAPGDFSTILTQFENTAESGGKYRYVLTVNDGVKDSLEYSQEFTLISDVDAPTTNLKDEYVLSPKEAANIEFTVQDNVYDSSKLTVTVEGLPEGLTFDQENLKIVGKTDKTGKHTVTVKVSDPAGNILTKEVNIMLRDAHLPQLDIASTYFGDNVTPLNIPYTLTDLTDSTEPGSATLTLKAGETKVPDGVTVTSTAIVGTVSAPGVYKVVAVGRDESGNTVEKPLTIVIRDAVPPTIQVKDKVAATEGAAITVPVSVFDDSGKSVNVEVSGLPDGLSFDGFEIHGTPSTPGTYTVTVKATDVDGNTAEKNINIVVKPKTGGAATPTITVNDSTVSANTTSKTTAPIEFSGITSEQAIVSIVVEDGATGFAVENGQLTVNTKTPGVHNIKVTVRDKNSTAAGQGTVTVTVVDTTSPVLTVPSDVTANVGGEVNVNVTVSDNDGTNITPTVDGELPPGVTFDGHKFTGAPTTAGDFTVSVTATDTAGNSTTKQISFHVLDTGVAVPQISVPAVSTFNIGEQVIVTPTVTATGKYSVTISGNIPEGVTFDSETGSTSGEAKTPGVYEVVFQVTDEAGATNQAAGVIVIKDNIAPEINVPDSVNANVNSDVTIPVEVSDNSGGNVSVTVDGLPDGFVYNSDTGTIDGNSSGIDGFVATITATDESGNATTKEVTVSVKDTEPPAIMGYFANGGTASPTVLRGRITDNVQLASVEVESADGQASFNEDSQEITFSPTVPGKGIITITATDSSGNVATRMVNIDNTPSPEAPAPNVNPNVPNNPNIVPPNWPLPGNSDKPGGDKLGKKNNKNGNEEKKPGGENRDGKKPIPAEGDKIIDTSPDQQIKDNPWPPCDGCSWEKVDGPGGVLVDKQTGEITGKIHTPGEYVITVASTDPSGVRKLHKVRIRVAEPKVAPITTPSTTQPKVPQTAGTKTPVTLARTGTNSESLAAFSLLLLLTGAGVLTFSRRKKVAVIKTTTNI